MASVRPDQSFKGRQFTAEAILGAVRWHLMFPISYHDLELMLADCGAEVAHITLFHWTQSHAPEIEKRLRPHLRLSNGSWQVDETSVRVKDRWMYLYLAVDSRGQTIDFLLSARRDAEAAKGRDQLGPIRWSPGCEPPATLPKAPESARQIGAITLSQTGFAGFTKRTANSS